MPVVYTPPKRPEEALVSQPTEFGPILSAFLSSKPTQLAFEAQTTSIHSEPKTLLVEHPTKKTHAAKKRIPVDFMALAEKQTREQERRRRERKAVPAALMTLLKLEQNGKWSPSAALDEALGGKLDVTEDAPADTEDWEWATAKVRLQLMRNVEFIDETYDAVSRCEGHFEHGRGEDVAAAVRKAFEPAVWADDPDRYPLLTDSAHALQEYEAAERARAEAAKPRKPPPKKVRAGLSLEDAEREKAWQEAVAELRDVAGPSMLTVKQRKKKDSKILRCFDPELQALIGAEFDALAPVKTSSSESRRGAHAEIPVGAVVRVDYRGVVGEAVVERRAPGGASYDLRMGDVLKRRVPRSNVRLVRVDADGRDAPVRPARRGERDLLALWTKSWSKCPTRAAEMKRLESLRERVRLDRKPPWQSSTVLAHDNRKPPKPTPSARRHDPKCVPQDVVATKRLRRAPRTLSAIVAQYADVPVQPERAKLTKALVDACLDLEKLREDARRHLELLDETWAERGRSALEKSRAAALFVRDHLDPLVPATVRLVTVRLDWTSAVGPRPFLFDNADPVLSLTESLDFLAESQPLTAFLGADFPLRRNPLLLPVPVATRDQAAALVASPAKPPHKHWPSIGRGAEARRRAYRAADAILALEASLAGVIDQLNDLLPSSTPGAPAPAPAEDLQLGPRSSSSTTRRRSRSSSSLSSPSRRPSLREATPPLLPPTEEDD